MPSNFTPGRILRGVNVVFDGEIWIEDLTAKKGAVPWKAGFFSAQTMPVIPGDCRLELSDGRTGTMTCTKSQPGMSGGSSLQFNGVGPLSGPGGAAAEEFLPEKVDLRLTRVEMQQFQKAAEKAGLPLTKWMREGLRKVAKEES